MFGEYRSRRLSLSSYDAIGQAIERGETFAGVLGDVQNAEGVGIAL